MKTIIKFYADWCQPCKAYNETFIKFAEDNKDKTEFKSINVEVEPELATKYQIRGVPSTVVIENGKLLKTKVGVLSYEELEELQEK